MNPSEAPHAEPLLTMQERGSLWTTLLLDILVTQEHMPGGNWRCYPGDNRLVAYPTSRFSELTSAGSGCAQRTDQRATASLENPRNISQPCSSLRQ